MPWTGPEFAAKHNHKLRGRAANEAARIATAMVNRGVQEGEAIATANKRVRVGPAKFKEHKTRREYA